MAQCHQALSSFMSLPVSFLSPGRFTVVEITSQHAQGSWLRFHPFLWRSKGVVLALMASSFLCHFETRAGPRSILGPLDPVSVVGGLPSGTTFSGTC